MSKYNKFVETGDKFIPYKIDGTHGTLPTGAYRPEINQDTGQVEFHKINLTCDNIIDLPSKEYEYVVNQMKHFLKPETKDTFTKEGFVYKRSVLLHGKPGTGKTVIVNRVVKEALANDAIVLFNPDPRELEYHYEALNSTNPDKLTVVIFEELDNLVANKNHEIALLSILDGEVQKNNVIYLATTNYIDNISLRIQRPGRFSSIVEVDFPTAEARVAYLKAKRVDSDKLEVWVGKTQGFSIDELKETVLAVKCLGESLDIVVNRITSLKEKGLESESRNSDKEKRAATELLNEIYGATQAMMKPLKWNK